MEVWKDIPGYAGMYQVSNLGRVKSLERDTKRSRPQHIKERILKQTPNKTSGNYLQVYLADAGKYKAFLVHRLVAQAFIPNTDNKPVVNHKDGNKQNNCLENLEWCTHKENVLHAFVTGLNIPIDKRKNGVWNVVIEVQNGKYKVLEYSPIER